MPSWSARAAAGLLRALNARRVWADPAEAENHLRTLATRPLRYAPPKRLLRSDVTVEAGRFAGWPVYTLRPKSAPPTGVLVYAHGGGWVHEIHALHWRFVAQVVTQAQVAAVVPIYPLAPFGTAGQVVPVVADLAEQASAEYGPLVLAGDSAGGQIALSTALRRRDAGRAPAALTVLIAPAVDARLDNPEIAEVARLDPWLAVEGTRVFAEAWRGDLSLSDPMVSPIEGDMTGLGPVVITCGTLDIVVPDVRLLVAKLRAADVPVTYREAPDLVHAYPLLPITEGRLAREVIAGQIHAALRRASAASP
ncbi:MAG: alpha/beta hydrolase fold domain-containing protein [Austwickia sp.]|nr:MAG: alpha/beta hydrolase fold domain-containing protein [Austwickia sp.]